MLSTSCDGETTCVSCGGRRCSEASRDMRAESQALARNTKNIVPKAIAFVLWLHDLACVQTIGQQHLFDDPETLVPCHFLACGTDATHRDACSAVYIHGDFEWWLQPRTWTPRRVHKRQSRSAQTWTLWAYKLKTSRANNTTSSED